MTFMLGFALFCPVYADGMDKKSFNLLDRSSWDEVFLRQIRKIIPSEIIERVKENLPEYFDDLDWLDELTSLEFGCDFDIKTKIANFIADEYDFIRAFHATRIDSVESFYKRGLCPLMLDDVESKARKIFSKEAYPEISNDQLNDAIEKSRQYQTGEVWFHLNKNYLIREANHYLEFFGGEYLQSIAANLSSYSSCYRDKLRYIGYPVIFECDIPIDFVKFEYLREAGKVIFVEIMYEIFDGRCEKDAELHNIDFSIEINQVLLPNFILGHKEL
jgi:hypothetical protein